jgi:IS5 family transposase
MGSQPLVETKPLADILSPDHPLIVITKKVDWAGLEGEASKKYSLKRGRPALPLRLMIGLLLLKYITDLSDEQVVENWRENVYFQAFTGEGVYQDRLPCNPSMMTVFRQRIGREVCELILGESVRVHGPKALEKACILDTTVQPKNITFPTDFKLISSAILLILSIGAFLGIPFAKKYVAERKELKNQINFGKKSMPADVKEGCIARLRDIGNTLLREFTDKLPKDCWRFEAIQKLVRNLRKAINQRKNDKNKIYSLNEPQVKCIAKGKAHVRYEFGSKVSVAVGKCKGIILGILNFRDNPYDGNTIQSAHEQMSRLHNGYTPDTSITDRGYKGREDIDGPNKIITPYCLIKELPLELVRKIKLFLKRRSSIEPIIGHLRSDHRMGRNYLKGELGDDINPLMAAAGFNFVKFGRISSGRLCRPPKSLNAVRRKNKYPGLPLWRQGKLFINHSG